MPKLLKTLVGRMPTSRVEKGILDLDIVTSFIKSMHGVLLECRFCHSVYELFFVSARAIYQTFTFPLLS